MGRGGVEKGQQENFQAYFFFLRGSGWSQMCQKYFCLES